MNRTHDTITLIIDNPDLTTPDAARVLLGLAKAVAGGDPDVAGDVILELTERLRPGGIIRARLATHANPSALIVVSARNAANRSREKTGRLKRVMPLTHDGNLEAVLPPSGFSPTHGLFGLLGERGWTLDHLEQLAIPRKRPGRSVHPGIEDALQHLASCYGVTTRCPGCPTEMDLLRVDLRGPSSWPHLVPVLLEWSWPTDIIEWITTTPANVGQWRRLGIRPPVRQERRMVEIARRMRVEPWLLQDSQAIRESIRPANHRPPAAETGLEPAPCRRAS